jgi:predicted  nucleic acid-binding Zn-ribbon protein
MEVRMGKAIHQCPNCSRILYHVEPETAEEQ